MTCLTRNNSTAPVDSRMSPVRGINFIEPIGHFHKRQPGQKKVPSKNFNHKSASDSHPHGTTTLPDWTHGGVMYRFPLRRDAVEGCRTRHGCSRLGFAAS